MRKIIVYFILAFSLFSCNSKKDTIQIGAVLPLSGDVAVYGNNTKKGIDLAVKKINENGGINGRLIEVDYEDSKAIPKEGVAAFQKLMLNKNIHYVIDNSVSSVALAMVPLADRNNIIILSTGSTNPKLSGISDWFFRIWNSDAFEGKYSADYSYDSLKIMSTAIIYVNNDYGVSLKNVYQKEFTKKGGNVVAIESFGQDATDFRTQLTKIKNASPEGIYIIGYSKEISNLLIQIKRLNINSKLVGTVTMEDRQVLEIAGKSADGVMYPFPSEPDTTKPSVSNFQNSYQSEYNEKPGITADVGYDAVYLYKIAVELSDGFTSDKLRSGLNKIMNYYGASGIIEFDENGDVSKPMVFKIIDNGNFNILRHE